MNQTYSLSAENIDAFSEELFRYIIEKKLDRRVALKARLTAETVLSRWLSLLPDGSAFSVETRHILSRTHILLKAKGAALGSVLETDDDEFYQSMLVNMEAAYTQRYADGYNIFDIKLPRPQLGSIGKVLAAIACAVLLGELMRLIFPQNALDLINKGIISPAFDAMMRMLGATASFMIFTSIVVSISCVQNICTLRTMGLNLFLQHFKLMNLFVLMTAGFCIVCFPVMNISGGIDTSVFLEVYDMLLDIIPGNFISPFLDGNTLQIVFLAVVFGVVVLILDSEVTPVKAAAASLNRVFQTIMMGVCEFMPFIIFLSFLQIVMTDSLLLALGAWRVVAAEAVLTVVIWFIYLWQVKRCSEYSFVQVIRDFIPLTILAFTSSSTVACLKHEEELLRSKYHVERSTLDFGLPVGLVLSKPGYAITFIILVYGLSAACGQTVSLGQTLTLILTSAILSLAIPPITGGMVAFLAVLFAQYGLPVEMLCIIIAINFIFDMLQSISHSVGNAAQIVVLDHNIKNKKR